MDITVDYVAVLIAAVVSMAIGFAWYSPKVLGNPWMRLSGIHPDPNNKKAMQKALTVNMVMSLISAFVLAHFVVLVNATDVAGAIQLAFWAWLGFMAPVMIGVIAWEGKPLALFAINAGYQLVQLIAMALVLALW